MELPKQDRNGVRTPTDLERRYKLERMNKKIDTSETRLKKLEETTKIDGELSKTSTNAVENRVVTKALNDKVDKVEGKQLSSNDFTDADKRSIHIHDNRNILDMITNQDILNWNNTLNLLQLIADKYDENITYNIGDYVVYNNFLYKCKVAIGEAEFWNEDNWERTTIMEEVKGGRVVGKD